MRRISCAVTAPTFSIEMHRYCELTCGWARMELGLGGGT